MNAQYFSHTLAVCSPPAGWCGGGNYQVADSRRVDCDGDGTADYVCIDALGNRGVILNNQTAIACEDTWPSVDRSAARCPVFFLQRELVIDDDLRLGHMRVITHQGSYGRQLYSLPSVTVMHAYD